MGYTDRVIVAPVGNNLAKVSDANAYPNLGINSAKPSLILV
ncbi:MAG: hypothetical protein AAGJ08_11695 [Cyanobacteria bacterium P01_H01_bin.35]